MDSPESAQPCAVEDRKMDLPGLGLPLDYVPEELDENGRRRSKLLPTALNMQDIKDGHVSLPLITLREISMLRLMNQITDKESWDIKLIAEKVFDEDIVTRWRAEALASYSFADFTVPMMDWVIAELRYKASILQQTGMVTVYNGNVVKSDTAVPESTKVALKDAVHALENDPLCPMDIHPGSRGMVRNLVHPSLFPLVYGRSRVCRTGSIGTEDAVSKIGVGDITRVPQLPTIAETNYYSGAGQRPWWRWPGRNITRPYSNKFQWLPCEVELSDDGKCKIVSYINNLHPREHKGLYSIVEEVIACAIPLWNLTLTPLDPRYRDRHRQRRIEYDEFTYEPYPESLRPVQQPGETEEGHWERESAWQSEQRLANAILPEPGIFSPPEESAQVDIRKDFGRNLQIIVKLANIELTPDRPYYRGGTWHVEGQMNEHICATALYYYDCENISRSQLGFRQESFADRDVGYQQDEHEWLEAVFGCRQHGPQVQNIGSVLCQEDRLLTFPNTMQHQVYNFSLKDRTKPGHRKILALFLVDPNIRIVSTANIPPQRQDWWREEIHREQSWSRLPVELQEQIMDGVDFPIHLEEAKELRAELMEERTAFTEEQTGAFESLTWSLCEH
ncbi:hypothetical protein FQN50_009060 [Emmonsiellopsis sp. PD_5]|nr:hypothetical protein FQN50_009060 [Emmonsiellopsis sp. PD_5]